MSSTEAEYCALADGAKEAVYLKRLLQELDLPSVSKVPVDCLSKEVHLNLSKGAVPTELDMHLRCDNSSAIKLARNPVFHARSKHIELHHHFIRERIIEGEIDVDYISTEDQPADLLTKALAQPLFEKHRHAMGVRSLQAIKAMQ
jgi:hypothetical protein